MSDQPETPTDKHPAPRATRPEAAAVAIGGSSASVSSAASGDAARATVAIGAIKVPSAEELRALSAAGVLQGSGGAPPGAAGGPGTLHTRRLPAIDLIRREPQVSADHPTLRDAFERPSPGLVGRARRVGPLALLLALGALAVAGWSLRGASSAEARAGTTVSEPVDTRISLPATQAIFGLTEDNKEAVLALCWRVSSNPNTECRRSYLRDTAEYPHREVAIPALDVDRDEVSNAAWDACERSGQCPARDLDACRIYSVRGLSLSAELGESARSPDRPAVCVTHAEAEQFCEARGGRLPTVEEWERVARAGGELLQPWGQFWSPAMTNWGERDMGGFPIPGRLDGHEFVAPVDAYRDGATSDGVRNVLGNVGEWVAPSELDAEGRAGVRGGDFTDDLAVLRATRHRSLSRDTRRNTVGFRCVYEPLAAR